MWGPLTFQAEYAANVLNGAGVGTGPAGDLFFQGCYAVVLWLLTGERRGFNNRTYVPDRVVP